MRVEIPVDLFYFVLKPVWQEIKLEMNGIDFGIQLAGRSELYILETIKNKGHKQKGFKFSHIQVEQCKM